MVAQQRKEGSNHVFTFEYTIKLKGSRKIKAATRELAIFKMRNALEGSIKDLRNDPLAHHLDSSGSFQLMEEDGDNVSIEERDNLSRNYDMKI
jgi:hypothetical protein